MGSGKWVRFYFSLLTLLTWMEMLQIFLCVRKGRKQCYSAVHLLLGYFFFFFFFEIIIR